MSVFVLNNDNKPLIPCNEKRARQLLDRKQAVLVRTYPFVIKLKNPINTFVDGLRLKIDPGSKFTGLALLHGDSIVWLGELRHRVGLEDNMKSRASLRRGRRSRHTRYRAARFDNRVKPKGWLPPSTRARVDELASAINKLRKWTPITSISVENVKFDMQKMMNPEVSGVEYQQGELFGYEVRAYVQEKYHHKCAYCGKADYELGMKFEIEHIIPKSRGGSNRISNLALACKKCNDKKGNMTAAEFGHPEVEKFCKASLKDAAGVNTLRWAIYNMLKETRLPVETGSGGRTKFNRTKLGLPKLHCIDAACVGASTPDKIITVPEYYDIWEAKGRGTRKMANQIDTYGFPKAHRSKERRVNGFGSGDVVKRLGGKNPGVIGKLIASKKSPYLISFKDGKRYSAPFKDVVLIQQNDGWKYSQEKIKIEV